MNRLFVLIKKKRIMFPLIFFGQIGLIAAIANAFDLETANSPLGMIYAFIMCCTLICFLVKILKDHRAWVSVTKIPFFGFFVKEMLYLAMAILTVSLIVLILTVLLSF